MLQLQLVLFYALYCQKYSVIHPNDWNQLFHSLPWPQVNKSKHLGMQTVSTNICERMGCSKELSEFQRGTVTGCYLCNKSSREISSLPNIPQSTVSGIIAKWKRLGMTATSPKSPGHVKWRSGFAEFVNFLQSQSLQTSKVHVALAQCIESFMERVCMQPLDSRAGLPVQHQYVTSQMCFWKNGQKFT